MWEKANKWQIYSMINSSFIRLNNCYLSDATSQHFIECGRETQVMRGFCSTWYCRGSTSCYVELVFLSYKFGNAWTHSFKFFPHIVLPTINLWGNQVARFMYVVRTDELCHTMYIIEYKYTDRITLSLGTEVDMFPVFILTCIVILLCNVR